ncbi:hypothetical protein [Fusobacterium hwasookii]|jgi:hypothetical protein|uniref:Lipoprotein n=2 Tax=Fusobacterium hwasookii TaxID=1583098 RepID=A0A0S2ZJN6_9FUSO|nr:hypothetical protein [Fusobacterium hwasookii]ALQ34543.1 hypothetical protein RN92_00965 [Fusobacterium hwasookii ChDC F206]ALQ38849.1 hypothetical protein RN97_11890 [Fusobacterium hwasookii ChDC F300]ALQ39064.1 hypothetical protein RN87_00420 [Fusobacterium hwasookii ChDC F174]QNE69240.1 hypothetical protein H5V38_04530 [Fusobacterium hwasookii]QYR55709.1 hypothetical protein JY400_03785 [Fusobacterium hwasookii]
MKKILILMVMVFGLVACGEKFPYTSQRDKEKMSKELLVAIEKAQKTQDQEDTKVAMEKMGEIIKIITELEKRSSSGDEKAKEELDKWEKILKEIKPQV